MFELPPELLKRVRGYGLRRVEFYEKYPERCALSSHGAEKSPELQARGKGGECALALWDNLDVDKCGINWSDEPDRDGIDMVLPPRLTADVKTIESHKHYLCWAIRKNDKFKDSKVNVLVLVKQYGTVFPTPASDAPPRYLVHKWISKYDFGKNYRIAVDADRVQPGTWFMDEPDLYEMRSLRVYLDAIRWMFKDCSK
jgi:hypothetical protein